MYDNDNVRIRNQTELQFLMHFEFIVRFEVYKSHFRLSIETYTHIMSVSFIFKKKVMCICMYMFISTDVVNFVIQNQEEEEKKRTQQRTQKCIMHRKKTRKGKVEHF